MNDNLDLSATAEEIDVPAEQTPPRGKLPMFARVFYVLALICIPLYIGFLISPAFADFFNRHIASIFRTILAKLTDPLPFSLAEFLILLLPVILFFVIRYGIRHFADNWHRVLIYCGSVLSLVALLFSAFTIGFASGYRGTKLEQKLGLSRTEVSANELYGTALWLIDGIHHEAESVIFGSDGFSVMPYDLWEMNDKLMEAYDAADEKYTFLQRLDSDLKPVMLSHPMSYTHITGIYTFFTGEANLNVNFPDYTLPYTAAHELAHQRGIAREDEANFMAFLVCMESDDPYIRYSAYHNLYDYVISALYSADQLLYSRAQTMLSSAVRGERIAYSAFFDRYDNSVVSEVSGAVNNTYLTLQGTAGTKSYGMVVDLAVAYWRGH